MPPWPRIAISVYPQARCLWTSSTWILSAAFVKRSRSTRLQPPLWSSEDQEKKFGTFIKGRSRLAWFRARRALRESPTSKKPQILPNNVASRPCRRIADSYRRIPMIRSTRKRSQRCERWLAIAETMGRTSATRPARRHPSRRARDSGRRARQSGRELRSREPDSLRQGNPVDAIELLGSYVQGIHAKDGMWPANPRELGKEVPIGKGKVDFPRIIERLRQLNYRGAVTIERDRKSTRLNSSHGYISYAVFCLKKKTT